VNHLCRGWWDEENNGSKMEPDDFILPEDEEPHDRHEQQRLDDKALEAKRLREELEKIAKTMDELMRIHLCKKQAE